MFQYLYYIYLIISLFEILNAFDVKSENDLINYLSNSDGEITLKINSEIDITKKKY